MWNKDKIRDFLEENEEVSYGDFQSKLCPTVSRETILGIRVPKLRKFAKELLVSGCVDDFFDDLPHKYYDENILHAILLSELKNYDELVERIDDFLPYVDNWAVCDGISPKIFSKNRESLLEKVKMWMSSDDIYTIRFGVGVLMRQYLTDDFDREFLEWPVSIVSEEYYVNMMLAWFYATALTKRWDEAILYVRDYRLGRWVHNKTIQKACESLAIGEEKKEYLKQFRITSKSGLIG